MKQNRDKKTSRLNKRRDKSQDALSPSVINHLHQAKSNGWFGRFARSVAHFSGRPATFVVAFAIIVAWGISGPLFGYSDTWQLIINTGTTIITFLMVFLIQNTQNRDSEAIQLKLDELIRAVQGARNELIDAEDLSEKELSQMKKRYDTIVEQLHPNKH